jgi:hypothetical protein
MPCFWKNKVFYYQTSCFRSPVDTYTCQTVAAAFLRNKERKKEKLD